MNSNQNEKEAPKTISYSTESSTSKTIETDTVSEAPRTINTDTVSEAPKPISNPIENSAPKPNSNSNNGNSHSNSTYFNESDLPKQYKPLSPWGYFLYALLFGVPVIGLICLIIFSFSDSNINRRNFSRSFFCGLLISLILLVVLIILGLVTGAGFDLIDQINSISNQY